jgi:hypothetical protein
MYMMMMSVIILIHSTSVANVLLTHHRLYYYRPARLYGYLSEESRVSRDHHRHLWRELLQSTLSDSPE